MQFKRTFLLSVVVGLASVIQLLAHAGGPDPGVNGVFAAPNGVANNCSTSGCHDSFLANSGNGSVAITGLPTSWVPGQQYALKVTVTGGVVYGFQLSSVFNSTNQQAGTLAKVNAAVQVIYGTGFEQPPYPGASSSTPGAIQFAEHTSATGVNTFQVNWTAPSTAAGGTVRFNVAGNAANGDFTNQGDHIYTKIYTVDPAVVVDLSVHAFTMVDRGGVSVITDGSGSVVGGYARILATSGTTPSGVAIFGERTNGILVTEAGVPASPLIKNGRIYAEVGPGGNAVLGSTIGLAIANPDAVTTANIGFTVTDTTGADKVTGTINLAPGQKVASFLDEAPWNVPDGFRGTFTFHSQIGVSVVALLGYRNERVPADFLITTLPVINLDTYTPGTAAALVPYFTDGGGWNTTILLVNPTDSAMSGTIQFHQALDGSIQPISANGTKSATASFAYTISSHSAFRLKTDGAGNFQNGSVTITPGAGTNTPVPLAAFGFVENGITTTQAGVPSNSSTAFQTFVEATPGRTTQTSGSYSTGIAIGNSTGSKVTATLNLYSTAGIPVGTTTVDIAGNGVMAKFLEELFPNLPLPFQGVLEITCGTPISVVGLRIRYNERVPADFLLTTIPPTDEFIGTTTAESDFPHILNGGGYTTEFILFSGVPGQTSSGNLKFLNPNGSNLNLNVN